MKEKHASPKPNEKVENGLKKSSDNASPESVLTQAGTPAPPAPKEFGGPKGPEPTRYGDWEQKGRCTDF